MNTAVAPENEDLRRQVRDLLDREEIRALIDRLAVALEDGRFEQFKSIYTADVKAKSPGGEAQGIDTVIKLAGRNHSDDQRTPHYISNVRIDLSGDEAAVHAYAVIAIVPRAAAEGRPAPEPLFTGGGWYKFDAIRTPEGWRFSTIETALAWSTGALPY